MKLDLTPAEFHDLMNALGLAMMRDDDRRKLIERALAGFTLPKGSI